ncbi:unnamed protein product, partial [Didymodactylos carnosus]
MLSRTRLSREKNLRAFLS